MNKKYYVMSFGLGGNSAVGIDEDGHEFTSSWYIKPEELQQYICERHYKPEEMENCWLVDKIAVLETEPVLAYQSPIPSVKKQNRFKDLNADPILTNEVEKNFGIVGECAKIARKDDNFEGLDYASVNYYVRWWSIRGAKIGKVYNGKVEWIK